VGMFSKKQNNKHINFDIKSIYGKGALRTWRPDQDLETIPEFPGEYRLYSIDCVYIGITGNLRTRIYTHLNAIKVNNLSCVKYLTVKPENILALGLRMEQVEQAIRNHEMEKIKKYKPLLNVNSGGGGKSLNLVHLETEVERLRVETEVERLREELYRDTSFIKSIFSLLKLDIK